MAVSSNNVIHLVSVSSILCVELRRGRQSTARLDPQTLNHRRALIDTGTTRNGRMVVLIMTPALSAGTFAMAHILSTIGPGPAD